MFLLNVYTDPLIDIKIMDDAIHFLEFYQKIVPYVRKGNWH